MRQLVAWLRSLLRRPPAAQPTAPKPTIACSCDNPDPRPDAPQPPSRRAASSVLPFLF